MSVKHPWLKLALVGTLSFTTACQGSNAELNKPLPEFPLTLEGLEAFADKADFELIQQYSMYHLNDDSLLDLPHRSRIVLEYVDFRLINGLITFYTNGGYIINSYGFGHDRQSIIDNMNIWDQSGNLHYLGLRGFDTDDYSRIFEHKNLKGVHLLTASELESPDVDISDFKKIKTLENLATARSKVLNLGLICQFPKLSYYNGMVVFPQGAVRFENCTDSLKVLTLPTSRLDDIEFANLPGLQFISLANANIAKLAVDGATLPNLEFINFSQTRLPEDLSQVNLPRNLKQIDLSNSGGDRLNRLVLPENLKYINLRYSNFSDYSFLITAKNLESLHLGESAFNQFELLAELPNLKHLVLSSTSLQDDHLKYIAQLKQLEYLSMSGTKISDLSELKNLERLSTLILYAAESIDLEKIPFFTKMSFLGMPNQDDQHDRPSDLPLQVSKMMDATDYSDLSRSYGNQCFFTDDCTLAPWRIQTMKERFPDHPFSN